MRIGILEAVRIASIGQVVFGVVVLALGVVGVIKPDYMPLWQAPEHVPLALVYLCEVVSIACGIAMLVPRTAALAARVFFGYLALWSLVFRIYDIVTGPTEFGSWDGCAEAGVIVAGAWLLYARLATDWDRKHVGFLVGETAVRIARALYGIAMIPFGLAHFLYLDRTVSMVPGWLPAHLAWACLTGGAFIAAGVAILVGVWARLAAMLSVVQIGAFLVLVWIPMIANGPIDPFEWVEVGMSAALMAAGWIVAESYRIRSDALGA